jgi:hypothetical protein
MTLRALASARTLKPMITALAEAARVASDSVMPPTPDSITLMVIISFDSATSDSRSACAEPCTSALTTMLRVCMPAPAPIGGDDVLHALAGLLDQAALALLGVALHGDFARQALVATTTKSSPASGTPDRPSTCTGIDGPACSTCLPFSSNSARTRPYCTPHTR